MENSFFALILRMKHINRWGLMRNTFSDNLAEHSLDTAIIAHSLCLIGNTLYGKNFDAERAAVLALFHDTSEIITGDMPTPVKYYSNEMRDLYKTLEHKASMQLIGHLPEELRNAYTDVMLPGEKDRELLVYLKAADKLSALIKCLQEVYSGNLEFSGALDAQKQSLENSPLPEVQYFLEHFIPAFTKSLDEQQGNFNILK